MHKFSSLGVSILRFCSNPASNLSHNPAKILLKHLIRQAEKLPKGPKQHYKFMIKQSFKQHMKETDQERIDQIIKRSYEDCNWILKKFWDSLLVYYNRPHLVNRKLAGHCQALFYEIEWNAKNAINLSDVLSHSAILYEVKKLESITKNHIDVSFLKNLTYCYDKDLNFKGSTIKEFADSSSGVYVSVRILLPKIKASDNAVEIVVLDKNKNEAMFQAVSKDEVILAPTFPYRVVLSSGNLKIMLDSIEDADTSSAVWLSDKLFDKLLKWASEEPSQKGESNIKSLSLIDIEAYCILYSKLKVKYSEPLIKVWHEKTTTDPKKYVYEDIAIATYLMCYWSLHTAKDQIRFVDLGCGNGLLVYLLNQEGYRGYGVDLRKRKVWEIYNGLADLREEAVLPHSSYPDSNWLIGNHSDELTPWIPIMALKSSPKTNFFVLPCCPYDLNGKKFIRYDTSVSQYSNYLSYVKKICDMCQFLSDTDKLRIPSTKRTCIVGIQTDCACRDVLLASVDQFVDSKCSGSEGASFVMRPSVEPVRNCTQIGKLVIDHIVHEIVGILLKTEQPKPKPDGGLWNKGGQMTLADLSKQMSAELLMKLKNESGGLQTLLRNHRYIFELNSGQVSLRGPLPLSENTKKYKDKPCWYLKNHPDGCLFSGSNCAYKH